MLLLLAVALALIAGFALQRGGICVVIAVREVIEQRRWARFLAFLECSAWALLGLLLVNLLGLMTIESWPRQTSMTMAAIGGALFGAGALLNGSCAFGSAGRFAAGEMSFLAWIPGFLLGVALASRFGVAVEMAPAAAGAPPRLMLIVLILMLSAFVLWRLWTAWRAARGPSGLIARLRAPHWPAPLAMAVIALANVALLTIIFAWPFTTVLVDAAFSRGMDLLARTMLVFVFLAGAWAGASSAGRFKWRGATWAEIASRFGGGALMGLGAALIPGGNDALVLLGLPLLQASAFVAYAAMTAVIAAGFVMQRRFGALRPSVKA